MRYLIACGLLALCGCNLVSGPSVNPDAPQPDVKPDVQPVSQQEYWEELAKHIEAGNIADTDVLILTLNRLDKRGIQLDRGRVSEWSEKLVRIDASNRQQIADKIRGK